MKPPTNYTPAPPRSVAARLTALETELAAVQQALATVLARLGPRDEVPPPYTAAFRSAPGVGSPPGTLPPNTGAYTWSIPVGASHSEAGTTVAHGRITHIDGVPYVEGTIRSNDPPYRVADASRAKPEPPEAR